MDDDGYISFANIDPAVLVHALYHGTGALGLGVSHDKPGLSLDQVRADLEKYIERDGDRLYIDYLHGRPLKLKPLLLKEEKFFARLYDRDAGRGAAQGIVDALRARSKESP